MVGSSDSIYRVVPHRFNSYTVNAGLFLEMKETLSVPSGYTPLSVVGFRSWSAHWAVIGAFLDADKVVYQVRNVSASNLTAQPAVWVLCVRSDLA